MQPQSPERIAIVSAFRRPEPDCVAALIPAATLTPAQAATARTIAVSLARGLRDHQRHSGLVDGLMHEFSLSSHEGVALMCLAEALLRIPDSATRDALIRDKISTADWYAHLGHSPSLAVNAAAWGLLVTGRLVGTSSETGLVATLSRLIAKGGEPVVRAGVDFAMRMMGEHFVMGQTIDAALRAARAREAKGFRYSYDMLGEAATTGTDAEHYFAAYRDAITAIGRVSAGRGIYAGPGISVKLSALHPRYCRASRDRVMAELLPRLAALSAQARACDIGLTIDAEEADRLELSLNLLAVLCFDSALAGWNGLGLAVQAYQKRAPYVLDYLIDLARRSQRRLMVRLVKGAYWDGEIKRAQSDGVADFPVFTRKVHTDLSYLACARKMLSAPQAIFAQFATHNAGTVAAIHTLAGDAAFEFQGLHGMGEALYDQVVGPDKLDRPCRIYAPVGPHETLLAYLVRRLLENGANSSFVNRIADLSVPLDDVIADPVAVATAVEPLGSPHPHILLPPALFGPDRTNSAGLDFSDDGTLDWLSEAVARPLASLAVEGRAIVNPADRGDVLAHVTDSTAAEIDGAVARASAAHARWRDTEPVDRAACLKRAADGIEAESGHLVALLVREAGKTLIAAAGEVREAVDFLRYYAAQIESHYTNATRVPLGVVACISPWNFPLAIFTGQIAAALAAGNAVVAKPAEETPLIAIETVRLLHRAGIPPDILRLLQGAGEVGGQLVADTRIGAVMFTGSFETAKAIERVLAFRPGPPAVLIAETGGLNAMIVDSSARPEQVAADALVSAFDSAGQRCSALRILCLQNEIAETVIGLLKGAMAELCVGPPGDPATDIGPVISDTAGRMITDHIAHMRALGKAVHQSALGPQCRTGSFVAPTLIEIGQVAEVGREVFGPVLHVMRFARTDLTALIDDINRTGYGLTFGLHTRIDETVARVTERVRAGNLYINRTMIGAVVGVQPFGGRGLSGTGPKAGGPLYLNRLLAHGPVALPATRPAPIMGAWCDWLRACGFGAAADCCAVLAAQARFGLALDLPGPVGERNRYELVPKGMVLCLAADFDILARQIGAALATGNRALISVPLGGLEPIPSVFHPHIAVTDDWRSTNFDAVLFDGGPQALADLRAHMAAGDGPIVAVQTTGGTAADFRLEGLMAERAISTNSAAAGGNADLMTIG